MQKNRCEAAITLAAEWAIQAEKGNKRLARLVSDPRGKAFAVAFIDQCFRSRDTKRVADQLVYLIKKMGIPSFLTPTERLGLKLFESLGKPFHWLLVPFIQKIIRKEASQFIQDEKKLQILPTSNLNYLGEAILGEEEAQRRLQKYLKGPFDEPLAGHVSVKISALYSQVSPLGSLQPLAERLKTLYRTQKFVTLDMEEYRDLSLTVELFQTVLSEPEFHTFKAGIVLQSYLPDSFLVQQELTRFALDRVQKGGAPIRIRLVKGANLAMEQVEASLRGWPQAPYLSKKETDANFKRMLEYGCGDPIQAVHLGIGSHNLFDVAYAYLLRKERQIEPYMGFEMLEGMADPYAQVLKELTGDLLLYTPVTDTEAFQYAIAYLIRRLDENTAQDNFLSGSLKPGTAAWKRQANLFREACEMAVSSAPRRSQNRFFEEGTIHVNEPDTDWSLLQNREWIKGVVADWKGRKTEIEKTKPLLDDSKNAQKIWENKSPRERSIILAKVATLLRKNRGPLIGVMMAETSKTASEADTEISEAVDFIEFYRQNGVEVHQLPDIRWRAKGVVLVASPWNFSCSIPVGGISAALAGGNSVLFKPAPEAVWVGHELCKLFWEAGIDRQLLQLVICEDEPDGSALVQNPDVAAVILTGATATARHFLQLRPGLDLMAETGGKNSLIITALSDRDLAIRDLLQSAFGYAGQKCSACGLAICEAEVYDDPHFRQTLKDAASSLIVGSPWDLSTRVNPLIRQPGEALQRGLTRLEEGEEWLLEPKQLGSLLWSPGIKLGVQPDGFTHQTELFGPVLGLMRADNLEQAISLANGTPYGLTAGIHTLDAREKAFWLSEIEAGNCYINRTITGAIVLRQPFGGCKASSFGPGAKAGGPNYLMQLMHAEQLEAPESYQHYWEAYFSQDQEPIQLLGQQNILRYVPRQLTLRVDSGVDVERAKRAAAICGATLEVNEEPEEQFIAQIQNGAITRVRCLSHPSQAILEAAAKAGITLYVAPVLTNGRLELLHYLREVSISHETHRYGNLF